MYSVLILNMPNSAAFILNSRKISSIFSCLLILVNLTNPVLAESIAEMLPIEKTRLSDNPNFEIRLDALMTLSNIMIKQHKVSELSGLFWDQDENILYALSDNGFLLHLRPVFKENKISGIDLLDGFPLLDAKNKPLRYKPSDSEGITALHADNKKRGDTELLISFERIPRIVRYQTNGTMIGEIKIPGILANIKNYQSENKSLESVVVHPKYGVLTGPELALRDLDTSSMYIYSMDGKIWNFPLHDNNNGALADLTMMSDGHVLALERAYGGIIPAINITLHQISLDDNAGKSTEIYTFKANHDGLNDNFEGITHYKGNHYFMVSDDNDHPLSRTVLLYFSINRKTQKY